MPYPVEAGVQHGAGGGRDSGYGAQVVPVRLRDVAPDERAGAARGEPERPEVPPMTAYRYPLPRRYRIRYPYKFRKDGSGVLPVVIAGAVLLAGAGAGTKAVTHHAHHGTAPATANAAASAVVAFARSKVGKVPYLWGGTSDAGMDCSGLAMEAYAADGISIERTSQQQWASERHVTSPVAGDLVFFAGSDGTPTAPGHVGIVADPARHTMIDAFGAGTYVRQEGYGPAASPRTGLNAVVGFTDPAPSRKGA